MTCPCSYYSSCPTGACTQFEITQRKRMMEEAEFWAKVKEYQADWKEERDGSPYA